MEEETNHKSCRRGGETEETREMAETEGDARTETEGSVDVETELLILKYQKNTDPDIKTLNLQKFWGGEE